MIKTHKPRGHIWSHASTFQQTRQYRNIIFDECVPPPSRAFVRDPDEDLSRSERSVKRRRIEKLADDFLNGVPLFISSATPGPQSLQSTVIWNKKSSNEPKFVLPNVDRSDEPHGRSSVWEDMEDDAKILERLTRERRKPALCETDHDVGHYDPDEGAELEEARASCGRVRRLDPIKITTGPSEEALRQAAALRARRFKRSNSEIPVASNALSVSAQVAEVEVEPRSEPSYETHANTKDREAAQWLSRRRSRFSFAETDVNDDSIDELQLSRAKTPSAASPRTRRLVDPHSPQRASYHTAPETTELEGELNLVHRPSQDDSGNKSRVGPSALRTPGTSVSEGTRQAEQHQQFAKTGIRKEHHGTSKTIESEFDVRNALLDSAEHNAGKRTKGRRTKSVGDNTPQHSSSSKGTRPVVSKSAYTMAKTSQNGSTPLIYRKGTLRSRDTEPHQPKNKNTHASGIPRTPRYTGAANLKRTENSLHSISGNPPLLDMSFTHDSSFAPNLNTALVDEHLNSILPSNPESHTRSSAIKKAIRREMRHSGAEISRCGSEPPSSSQVDQPVNLDNAANNESEPVESLQERWAGTQFLLKQAQKDLLTSPEKQNTNYSSADRASPQTIDIAPREEVCGREALKQLSQEHMPSTQQLLADFEGWSTVKKPRAVHRSSPLPTPTATGKTGWRAINSINRPALTSDLDASTDWLDRRRSNLRFSTSLVPSPDDTSLRHEATQFQSSPITSGLASASAPLGVLLSSDTRQQSTLHSSDVAKQFSCAQSKDDDPTLGSFTSGPLPLSVQAAQSQSQSQLLRDTSDLSETVEDLTRDVLCTEDLREVLSQVA